MSHLTDRVVELYATREEADELIAELVADEPDLFDLLGVVELEYAVHLRLPKDDSSRSRESLRPKHEPSARAQASVVIPYPHRGQVCAEIEVVLWGVLNVATQSVVAFFETREEAETFIGKVEVGDPETTDELEVVEVEFAVGLN